MFLLPLRALRFLSFSGTEATQESRSEQAPRSNHIPTAKIAAAPGCLAMTWGESQPSPDTWLSLVSPWQTL